MVRIFLGCYFCTQCASLLLKSFDSLRGGCDCCQIAVFTVISRFCLLFFESLGALCSRRGFWIPRKEKEPAWVVVKYERLQNFCYVCGRLGHDDRRCSEGLNRKLGEGAVKEYGSWLSVPAVKTFEGALVVCDKEWCEAPFIDRNIPNSNRRSWTSTSPEKPEGKANGDEGRLMVLRPKAGGSMGGEVSSDIWHTSRPSPPSDTPSPAAEQCFRYVPGPTVGDGLEDAGKPVVPSEPQPKMQVDAQSTYEVGQAMGICPVVDDVSRERGDQVVNHVKMQMDSGGTFGLVLGRGHMMVTSGSEILTGPEVSDLPDVLLGRINNISCGPAELVLNESLSAHMHNINKSADEHLLVPSVSPTILELNSPNESVSSPLSPDGVGIMTTNSSQPYNVDFPSDDESKMQSIIPINGLSPISAVSEGFKGIHIKRTYEDEVFPVERSKYRRLDFISAEDGPIVKSVGGDPRKGRRRILRSVKNHLRQLGDATQSIPPRDNSSLSESDFPTSWLNADNGMIVDYDSSLSNNAGGWMGPAAGAP
ncbi:hypothetical protein K1719_001814 [Acacia pycnantha]|nr:hypothetical protein K1719_001814 [Acacia pycnantha]